MRRFAPLRFFWIPCLAAVLGLLALRVAAWAGWKSAGAIAALDMPLQSIAIGLSLVALLRREWGHAEMSAASAIALAITIGDPLATIAHPFLLEHSLYPPFFGRGNDPSQSPQYARLLLWVAAISALAIAMGKRERRSLGRWFALLASGSVLCTGLLFHASAMIQVGYAQKKAQEEARWMLASASEAAFKDWCSMGGFVCASAQAGARVPKLPVPPAFERPIRSAWGDVGAAGAGSAALWRDTERREDFNRLPTALLGVGKPKEGVLRIWIDKERQRERLQVAEAIFALQALPAHLLWIYGGVALSLAHRRRALRRAEKKE